MLLLLPLSLSSAGRMMIIIFYSLISSWEESASGECFYKILEKIKFKRVFFVLNFKIIFEILKNYFFSSKIKFFKKKFWSKSILQLTSFNFLSCSFSFDCHWNVRTFKSLHDHRREFLIWALDIHINIIFYVRLREKNVNSDALSREISEICSFSNNR